ncbi:MAG: XrtB/PEP-CTERM-associated polysaccharide biosynthesis outer membrane protein EpsL [Methylophilaceae bacterium]
MIVPIRIHTVARLIGLAGVVYMCSSVFASDAIADAGDVFNVALGTSYQHNSNLFRLDSGQQPAGGGAERWDNILRTSVGFKINKHYSLQTFKFDYDHVENKYQNAKFLDFNADNYKAAWLWSITPGLTGNLSAERVEELVPFLDFRNTNTQNLRTKETQVFDFDWSPHNKWHLLGGYTKLDVVNSQTFLQETSFKFDAVEGGVKYSFPSESFIALKFRNRQGENQEINFSRFVGKGFTENEQELSATWILSGKSKLTSIYGHNRRTDDTFSIRDFSGNYGNIAYVWDATSKLNFTLDLTRRLAAFTETTSSYTVYDVMSLKSSWDVTSKVTINAIASQGTRKFRGDGFVFTPDEREDDMSSYGLGLNWVPRSTIKIGVNLQHDERDSNFVGRDYSANTASISGQLTF